MLAVWLAAGPSARRAKKRLYSKEEQAWRVSFELPGEREVKERRQTWARRRAMRAQLIKRREAKAALRKEGVFYKDNIGEWPEPDPMT